MSFIQAQRDVVVADYEATNTIHEVKKSGFYLNMLKNLRAKIEGDCDEMPGLREYLDADSAKHQIMVNSAACVFS